MNKITYSIIATLLLFVVVFSNVFLTADASRADKLALKLLLGFITMAFCLVYVLVLKKKGPADTDRYRKDIRWMLVAVIISMAVVFLADHFYFNPKADQLIRAHADRTR